MQEDSSKVTLQKNRVILPFQIRGIGYYLPKKEVSNEEYEKNYNLSSEWIKQVTGIETRRVCAPHESCSDMGTEAAKKALESANLLPQDIDLIILATTGPDYIIPPSSTIIQGKINASNAASMDINVACMGFVWGLNIAASFLKNNIYNHVLIIASETCSRAANIIDKNTFILAGDGAGAIVISKTKDKHQGIIGSFFKSDGKRNDAIRVYTDYRGAYEKAPLESQNNGNIYDNPILGGLSKEPDIQEKAVRKIFLPIMNGKKIFKFAVTSMNEAIEKLLKGYKISPSEVKWVFPHEANLRILEAAMKRSIIPSEKFFINVQKYGNTSAASIAIAMAEAYSQGKINPGDIIILVGFGAGLNWGATALIV